MLLPRDFGTMRLDYVFNLAIYHAETARPLVRRATRAIVGLKEFFEAERLTSAAMWLLGGVGPVLLQALSLLKRFDLGRLDHCETEFVHTVLDGNETHICRPRSLL